VLSEHELNPLSLSAIVSRRRLLRSLGLVSGAALGASLLAACQSAAPANQQASGPPAANQPASGPPAATSAPVAAATGAPAATAAPAAATAATSIKIGAVVPITGRYAALGEQVKNGYELAFKDLNKDGGVMVKALGKKMTLEMNLLDNASDATQTVQRLESLTSSDQVLAYLGGAGSDLHAAAAPVGDKNKTPYIAIAFALLQPHQQGLKYLFSPFPKSPLVATTTFDLMDAQSPKPQKVAIFAEKTDWGAELGDLWRKEAAARNYELVTDEQYAPGANDYSSMILKAKGAGANAVLTLPSPPDGMALAKQMKELDFNPDFDFFIRAADTLSWSSSLGKDGDYFIIAPGWHQAVKFPGAAQLAQEHQATYNKSAEALVGPAYAAVQILFDAVGRMSAPSGDALREALAATDMTTVVGPVKFNPDGTGQVIEVVNQWLDGKQVLVWPKDQAQQPLAYPAKPFKDR
jgi:branched-chain amino acid transport system substrate-binding protein